MENANSIKNLDSSKSRKKIYNCLTCGLSGNKIASHGDKNTAEVLIVSGVPTDSDIKFKRVLSGREGRLLNNALIRAGFDMSKVYYSGVILCQLQKQEPELPQIKSCGVNLVKLIDELPNLKLVIPLGQWALKFFLNKTSIKKLRGELFSKSGLNIFPIVDMPYIIANPQEQERLDGDLKKAFKILNNKIRKPSVKYELCTTLEEVIEARDFLVNEDVWAFDIETRGGEYGLDLFSKHNFITTVAFSTPNRNICIPIDHPESKIKDRAALVKLVENIFRSSSKKIAHEAPFDVKGIATFLGITGVNVYADTALMSSLIYQGDGSSNKLKRLSVEWLGYASDYSILADDVELAKLPINEVAKYNCEDTQNTLKLYFIFIEKLKDLSLLDLFFNVVMKGCNTLIEIELCGAKIDVAYGKSLIDKYLKVRDEWHNKLMSYPEVKTFNEFNLNSSQQLAVLLFDKFKLPIVKTTKTGPSTDAKVLLELKDDCEFIPDLLEYRKYEKLISTYVGRLTGEYLEDPKNKPAYLKSDHKIHCRFSQDTARTGRLSSSGPNMQNIPSRGPTGKEVKKLFVSSFSDGYILQADYSQIELRVAAIIAKEPTMIQIYKEGGDIHTKTVAEVFKKPISEVTPEERQGGKGINFGLIYGQSPKGLVAFAKAQYGVSFTLQEAERIREEYFKLYKGLVLWHKRSKIFAQTNGYVQTLFGRKRKILNINSYNSYERGKAERQSVNTEVQGTACDICLLALYHINEYLKKKNMKSRIINTVHDSIILEVPKDELMTTAKIVKTIMEKLPLPFEKIVPLQADLEYGPSWGDLEALSL